MSAAQRPQYEPANDDEAYRLAVLASLNLLDTQPEAEFDALVDIAQRLLDFPIALVSLVDDHRQWFKARCGLQASETSREVAFCAHAIHLDDIMVVPDATLDPRFRDNPLVTGEPRIRFYAGMQIRVSPDEGQPPAALGTLCVIDTKPRTLTASERMTLRQLAKLAETIIKGRKHVGDAVHYAEQQRADAARINLQHRQLGQAERMANLGSWRLTLDDGAYELSEQAYAIYGTAPGEKPTRDQVRKCFSPSDRALFDHVTMRAVRTGQPWDIEADFIDAKGVHKRVRSMGELEIGPDGKPVALVGVFQDISAKHELELTLRRLAHQDELTGLANRAAFNATLDDHMAGAKALNASFALVLVDLDGFKPVNDQHGHGAGDILLQEIGRRLAALGNDGWFAARQGGDEFALIAPIMAGEQAVRDVAANLLEALRLPIDIGGTTVSVSGTLGISWFDPSLTRRELIRRADTALYEAKRGGRGIARIFGEDVAISAPSA